MVGFQAREALSIGSTIRIPASPMFVHGVRCRCFLDNHGATGGHEMREGTLSCDGLDGKQVVLESIGKDLALTK